MGLEYLDVWFIQHVTSQCLGNNPGYHFRNDHGDLPVGQRAFF